MLQAFSYILIFIQEIVQTAHKEINENCRKYKRGFYE